MGNSVAPFLSGGTVEKCHSRPRLREGKPWPHEGGAPAGIQKCLKLLDPRFREDDKKCIFQQSPGFTQQFPGQSEM